MIEYVRGHVAELTPATVTIDVNGIGYLLNISLATFTALEGKNDALLLVHESIREDAYQLFGFAEESERALFRLLIGVSGVGANSARMILSAVTTSELEQAISSNDVKRLKTIKGIGTKTAERIIVDLRDKIKPDQTLTLHKDIPEASASFEEALTALIVLGYARTQAQKVLKKIYDAEPNLKVESAIRKALAML